MAATPDFKATARACGFFASTTAADNGENAVYRIAVTGKRMYARVVAMVNLFPNATITPYDPTARVQLITITVPSSRE